MEELADCFFSLVVNMAKGRQQSILAVASQAAFSFAATMKARGLWGHGVLLSLSA